MATYLHFTNGPAFAVAEITSLAFMELWEPTLREIGERTRRDGTRRLLLNLMDVVGTFEPEEQHAIGLIAHRHLSHLEKLASMVPPDKRTRVSEAAARARGMEVRVFTCLPDAVDWLVA